MVYQFNLSKIPKEELYSAITLVVSSLLIALAIFAGSRTFEKKDTQPLNVILDECGSGAELNTDCYMKFASQLDLDINQFETCVQENKYSAAIEEDKRLAVLQGVTDSNTFMIAKGNEDNLQGFILSSTPELDDFTKLVEILQNGTISDAQEFWFDFQLEELKVFRQGVRDFMASADGGGLKGKELDDTVSAIVADRRRQLEDHLEVRDVDLTGATVLGNSDIYFTNFTDYECSFCAIYAQSAGQQINAELFDTGMISLVFRDYIAEEIHPLANSAANAAKCAGEQGQYLEYYELLFRVGLE